MYFYKQILLLLKNKKLEFKNMHNKNNNNF